jgi:protein-tyrosine phosphatase
MIKILMVCLGNICRSPVAEGVMRSKLAKKGVNAIVDSAGTADFHVGEAPDKRSQKNALKNGIDISDLRGRQFGTKDFKDFDAIFAMDKSNYNNIVSLAKTEEQKRKVSLILSILDNVNEQEVPDPYYGTEADFQKVFELLDEACDKIVDNMQ